MGISVSASLESSWHADRKPSLDLGKTPRKEMGGPPLRASSKQGRNKAKNEKSVGRKATSERQIRKDCFEEDDQGAKMWT